MHAAITQRKKGIQRVLKQHYNHAGRANDVLNLLIDWSKQKYSYTNDDAPLKDILQEPAKAYSVHTLKDAPVPSTANTATTMLEKMCTTGNYDSSTENGE